VRKGIESRDSFTINSPYNTDSQTRKIKSTEQRVISTLSTDQRARALVISSDYEDGTLANKISNIVLRSNDTGVSTRVGINTPSGATPETALDVVGNMRVSGSPVPANWYNLQAGSI
jgi:hypothetical protein